MNTINITGNMTTAPVMRASGDKKVANFTVAVSGYGEHTDFIRCVAFGKTAEYLEKNADKGIRVAVTGSLHTDSYTNKDGQKVNTCDVYVRNVELTKKATPAESAPVEAEAPADFEELAGDDEALPFN